jgi:coenzyme F420-0:L-glutamate ligase/coenzyme F420-1:gamma-L-glutamate ligase
MTSPPDTPQEIAITAYLWPEITAGTDLAALVGETAELRDGDVVVITSKVVSKSEGRVEPGRRAEVIERELTRVVARRGPNVIAETRHGLVMAAAGVDASNVEEGSLVVLPADPDESARRLRRRLLYLTGRNVAVLVTDTAGRAWRNGQTDMAIGCAGIQPVVDLAGTVDTFGNLLSVTAPAIADEIAAAADLVKGKTSSRPLAVVRGLEDQVLPGHEPGPGALSLARGADDDLFGLGSRDAVAAAALRRDPVALAHFPRRIESDPEPFESVMSAVPGVRFSCMRQPAGPASGRWMVGIEAFLPAEPDAWMEVGALSERVASLAASHRLTAEALPAAKSSLTSGWQTITRILWTGP